MSDIMAQLNNSAQLALASMRRILGKMHRAETGTAMTEFIIVLPIFLLIFNGVMILGQFTREGTTRPIRAYKDTFEKVLPFQKDFPMATWSISPASGAVEAGVHMTDSHSPVHNVSPMVKGAAIVTEGLTYTGMGIKGTMGESYARANALTLVPSMKLMGCKKNGPDWTSGCTELNKTMGGTGDFNNGNLTANIDKIIGDSEYANALLNDAIQPAAFKPGTVLSTLMSGITVLGIRPALAAGIRYGTVYGRADDSYTFAGQTMEMDAYFSVLVPPATQSPKLDAARAGLTTRASMLGFGHYEKLLGIKGSQPLKSASFNVPNYPNPNP